MSTLLIRLVIGAVGAVFITVVMMAVAAMAMRESLAGRSRFGRLRSAS
jgi:hypothetical protein